jgi:hypothetical protein
MRFQPRGFNRLHTYANLVLDIRRKLDAIAAANDVSRSFVITTLLARQLHITRPECDFEEYRSDSERDHDRRHYRQIRRIK